MHCAGQNEHQFALQDKFEKVKNKNMNSDLEGKGHRDSNLSETFKVICMFLYYCDYKTFRKFDPDFVLPHVKATEIQTCARFLVNT